MTDKTEPADAQVGSLSEELLKLLSAVDGWASEAGATAGGLLRDVGAHTATGSQECRYCPVCQMLATARETSPEVRQHLRTAATSLLQAAMGLLQSGAERPGGRARGPVERIDLDEDVDDTPRES